MGMIKIEEQVVGVSLSNLNYKKHLKYNPIHYQHTTFI